MKVFLNLFNLVLVCVNFNRSAVTEQISNFFGLPTSKVRQIVHGSSCSILPNHISPNKLGSGERNLLCVGFVRHDKGYEYAIEALSLLKKKKINLKLIIAGTPNTVEGWNYLSLLKKQVKKLSLVNDVIFDTRYLKKEELYNYFSSSELLLLPYSRRVGPSGPLAIAATYGLPTIMTIEKKFALLNPGAFVELVPPNDSKTLAKSIEELLNDDDKLEKMKSEALAFSSKYSFEEVAKQHVSLYLSVIATEGS